MIRLNEKGFSLVELMVVVGVSAMITYVLYAAMLTGDVQTRTSDVKMAVQDSAREGLYKMLQEIRHSSSNPVNGNIVIAANSVTFNIPNPQNAVAGDFTENWANTHRIQYSLVGTQLIRTNLTTATTRVVANDVRILTFVRNGEVVTATMNVQRQLLNQRWVPVIPLAMTGQAELRNS